MKPFSPKSITIATVVASLIAARGVKRRSLSRAGALTAWMVGFLSIACGTRGFVLLMFYQIGTMATKYKKEYKATKDGDAGHSSVRGPSQVLACSAIAVACSLYHAIYYGEEKALNFNKNFEESAIACGILAHYATCLADTLASELGILSKSDPFFIVQPWKKVPPGTNGGVTLQGFFWSAFGGMLMSTGTLLMDVLSGIQVSALNTLCFGSACGLLGSLLDSLLGATLQATYYDPDKKLIHCCSDEIVSNKSKVDHLHGWNILSNVQVNLVSVLITTLVGGFYLGPLMMS